MLREPRNRVLATDDAREALTAIEHTPIDLQITDVAMPIR